jgi:hypothetical protein
MDFMEKYMPFFVVDFSGEWVYTDWRRLLAGLTGDRLID